MNVFLDENLSPYVADALNSLNKGYFSHIQVFSTITKVGKGKPDEDIIPFIGNVGGILITKDLNIQRTHLQYELCKSHDIGLFFLQFQKGHTKHWDIVKLLINRWEEIVELCKEKRPFAYRIKIRGKTEKL